MEINIILESIAIALQQTKKKTPISILNETFQKKYLASYLASPKREQRGKKTKDSGNNEEKKKNERK